MISSRFLALCVVASIAGLLGCSGESEDALLASAKKYLSQDDQRAAIIQIKNALQKDRNSAEARYLLGKALLESENPVAAVVELRKAAELKYSADALIPLQARALLAQGQPKKIIQEYSTTVLTSPAAVADLKTTLAAAFFAQGQAALAESSLAAALAAVPEHVPALVLRARMLASKNDIPASRALLDLAKRKAPRDVDVWLLEGDLRRLERADTAAIVEAYRQALAVRKDSLAAHSAIIEIAMAHGDVKAARDQLDALKKVRPGHPQTRLLEGQLALQQGDYKTAKEVTQQLLKAGLETPAVLQLSGAVAMQTGSLLQAEQYLTKALQLAPNLTFARGTLAQTYVRLGRPSKALATIEPLLRVADPSGAVLALAAGAHLQNGNAAQAEELYARAIEKDPNDTRSRTALALIHLYRDRAGSDESFDELQSISAADSGITADMALISASLRRKDFPGTLEAIDRLERKRPGKPMAAQLRGRVLVLTGDLQAARRSFDRALELDPTYLPAMESLASLDLQDGKPELAEQRYAKLLKIQPGNSRALLGLAGLRARAGNKAQEVIELLRRAIASNGEELRPRLALIEFQLKEKNPKEALSTAQDALTAIPDSPELIQALGRCQFALGDVNQGLVSFNKLVTLRPDSPLAHVALADAYVLAGKSDEAVDSLKRALVLAPRLLTVQQKLISLELAAGHQAQALDIARSVQQQRPMQADGFIYEGDIEAHGKHWNRAADAYRLALVKNSLSSVAGKLHLVLKVGGKKSDAEVFAIHWLKDHPQDGDFMNHLANVALAEKNYAEAESKLSQVVKLQPGNAAALNNFAWALFKLGKPGALGYAEQANRLRPNEPEFLDTWATILSAEHKFDQAIEIQQKALAMQPQNNMLRLSLARIYVRAGKRERAREELDNLAHLAEKFPSQAEVKRLRSQL